MKSARVFAACLGLLTACSGDRTAVQDAGGRDAATGDAGARDGPRITEAGPAGAGIAGLSLGDFHSCVLTKDGTVWCWGGNLYSQLGIGGSKHVCPKSEGDCSASPVQVVNLPVAVDIAAGYTTTCAATQDGSCLCWGTDFQGTLGGTSHSATPIQIAGLSGVMSLTAGNSHICARDKDGAVWCWGGNDKGQLGGTKTGSAPVKVGALKKAVSVVAGLSHTCAVVDDGGVWCWGSNEHGQLGSGQASAQSDVPVQVLDLVDVVAIATGGDHTCALHKDGGLWCWGRNTLGALGDNTYTARDKPVAVPGMTDVAAVAAGLFHTCALKKDGSVWCWGADDWGQLGDGKAGHGCTVSSRGFQHDCANAPVQVTGLAASAVAAGASHTCGLDKAGVLWCWGANTEGELGDGTITGADTPVAVKGL